MVSQRRRSLTRDSNNSVRFTTDPDSNGISERWSPQGNGRFCEWSHRFNSVLSLLYVTIFRKRASPLSDRLNERALKSRVESIRNET